MVYRCLVTVSALDISRRERDGADVTPRGHDDSTTNIVLVIIIIIIITSQNFCVSATTLSITLITASWF